MKPTKLLAASLMMLATAACATTTHAVAGPGAERAVPTLDPAHAGLNGPTGPDPAATDQTSATSVVAGADQAAPQHFGRWFHYASGLRVLIGAPVAFKPSGWVIRHPGAPMRFPVTVRNSTGDIWNPSQLHVRLQSGVRSAVQIFDYDKKVIARPSARLAKGHTVTFWVGYWVRDPRDLTVSFSPGFGYDIAVVKR